MRSQLILCVPHPLAAAKILKAREAELPGTIVLLFQPGEESAGGAVSHRCPCQSIDVHHNVRQHK